MKRIYLLSLLFITNAIVAQSFNMKTSSYSRKTVNGVVVEDKRSSSSLSNEGFSSKKSSYENGKFSESSIESNRSRNSNDAKSILKTLNSKKLSLVEKVQLAEQRRQEKMLSLQEKFDKAQQKRAKAQVEMNARVYDLEQDKKIDNNKIITDR